MCVQCLTSAKPAACFFCAGVLLAPGRGSLGMAMLGGVGVAGLGGSSDCAGASGTPRRASRLEIVELICVTKERRVLAAGSGFCRRLGECWHP